MRGSGRGGAGLARRGRGRIAGAAAGGAARGEQRRHQQQDRGARSGRIGRRPVPRAWRGQVAGRQWRIRRCALNIHDSSLAGITVSRAWNLHPAPARRKTETRGIRRFEVAVNMCISSTFRALRIIRMHRPFKMTGDSGRYFLSREPANRIHAAPARCLTNAGWRSSMTMIDGSAQRLRRETHRRAIRDTGRHSHCGARTATARLRTPRQLRRDRCQTHPSCGHEGSGMRSITTLVIGSRSREWPMLTLAPCRRVPQ